MSTKTLYERLGGYDAISAVVSDLMPRLRGDSQIGRFWQHRADDSLNRSKQLLIDFLSANDGFGAWVNGVNAAVLPGGPRPARAPQAG